MRLSALIGRVSGRAGHARAQVIRGLKNISGAHMYQAPGGRQALGNRQNNGVDNGQLLARKLEVSKAPRLIAHSLNENSVH
jgi:hypothetical protein